MSQPSDTYLDDFFADFDAAKMQAVLDESLRRGRMAEAMLEAYEAWAADQERPIVISGAEDDPGQEENGNGLTPTGQESILTIIDAGPDRREWTIPKIAQWLGLDERAHHAIGVSMSRLARKKRIARPRKGVYTKLPSNSRTTVEEGKREMRLDTGSQLGAG